MKQLALVLCSFKAMLHAQNSSSSWFNSWYVIPDNYQDGQFILMPHVAALEEEGEPQFRVMEERIMDKDNECLKHREETMRLNKIFGTAAPHPSSGTAPRCVWLPPTKLNTTSNLSMPASCCAAFADAIGIDCYSHSLT